MIYVVDKIGEVVDAMRKTGGFTVDSTDNGVYTLSSNNSLKENEWVTISGSNYKIINVTSSGFQIETSDELEDGNYKSLSPYYMYGHRLEISNRLKEKNQDEIFKYQKYPLIALRLDIPEEINGTVHEVSLNIAILEFTDRKYIAEERYENVFKPILYPLYENFLEEVEKANFMNLDIPDHTKIDRPFWGITGSEGNQKHIFDDPLDAIEIVDLKLKLLNIKCN